MKSLIILALIAISLCHLQSQPFITRENLDTIQPTTWVKYPYEEHPFKNWTLAEIKQLVGLKLLNFFPKPVKYGNLNDLPTNFDSRQQWPDCIHPIRDQGKCGSCWAHAASEVLSDRFCIASNSTINVVLSPQYLVSCDYIDFGCHGGTLPTSWTFLRFLGITTDGCMPYDAGTGHVDSCPLWSSTCADGSQFQKYYASDFYFLETIEKMRQSILDKGPIETGFAVYEDFLSYKGGIYKRTSDKLLGGHAVKIVGWGTEQNTPYWIVANSWGATWGENGYFRIAVGECGFETLVISGDPYLK
jgi:cathepsin B